MKPIPQTEVREGNTSCRRVGTFTFGLVLVAAGIAMLVSLFWPRLDFSWVLKCAPLTLISLGGETLLAARGGGRVKYDWVGMVLCALIVSTALALYVAAWYVLYCPDGFCF